MQILTESSDDEPAVRLGAASRDVPDSSLDNFLVIERPTKAKRLSLITDASSASDPSRGASPIRVQTIDPRDVKPVTDVEWGSCSTIASSISGKGSPQRRRPKAMLVEVCDSESDSFQSLVRRREHARGKGK
jgi:hypothetical protein